MIVWYKMPIADAHDPVWRETALETRVKLSVVLAVREQFYSQAAGFGSIYPDAVDSLLGERRGTARKVYEALERLGRIADGSLAPFEGREAAPANDNASTARVRAYRERRRQAQYEAEAETRETFPETREAVSETLPETPPEADETPQEKKRAEQMREEETETFPLSPEGETCPDLAEGESASASAPEEKSFEADGESGKSCAEADGLTPALAAVPAGETLPSARRKERQSRRGGENEPGGFAAWYENYPRHEARKVALAAWRRLEKAGRLPAFNVLLEAVERQRRVKGWDTDTTYCPLPGSWLNGERWTDTPVQRSEPLNTGRAGQAGAADPFTETMRNFERLRTFKQEAVSTIHIGPDGVPLKGAAPSFFGGMQDD